MTKIHIELELVSPEEVGEIIMDGNGLTDKLLYTLATNRAEAVIASGIDYDWQASPSVIRRSYDHRGFALNHQLAEPYAGIQGAADLVAAVPRTFSHSDLQTIIRNAEFDDPNSFLFGVHMMLGIYELQGKIQAHQGTGYMEPAPRMEYSTKTGLPLRFAYDPRTTITFEE